MIAKSCPYRYQWVHHDRCMFVCCSVCVCVAVRYSVLPCVIGKPYWYHYQWAQFDICVLPLFIACMRASVCVCARVFVCMCVHVRVYVRVYIAQTHMVIKICRKHHCTIITWYHETVSIRSSSLEGLMNLWSLSWQEIVITCPYVSVDHDIIIIMQHHCSALSS